MWRIGLADLTKRRQDRHTRDREAMGRTHSVTSLPEFWPTTGHSRKHGPAHQTRAFHSQIRHDACHPHLVSAARSLDRCNSDSSSLIHRICPCWTDRAGCFCLNFGLHHTSNLSGEAAIM